MSTDLHRRLAEASLGSPRAFALGLLNVVVDELELSAASFYLVSHGGATLRLKAQVGLDYERYESFQLDSDTIVGRAIAKRQPQMVTDLVGNVEYRDQRQLLDRDDLAAMGAIPIGITGAKTNLQVPDPLGAICIYGANPQTAERGISSLKADSVFIARLYLATVERFMMELRDKTVMGAAYSTDISSLVYRFLKTIGTELGFEAGSVFLLDPATGESLDLVSSTERRIGGVRINQVFLDPTAPLIEAVSRRTGTTITRSFEPPLTPSEDGIGAFSTTIHNLTCTPIQRRTKRSMDDDAFALLRLVNLRIKLGERTEPVHPNWEDVALTRFSSQMVSVLIHQMLRTQESEYRFERLMHGAQSALGSAIENLAFVEDQLEGSPLSEYGRRLGDAHMWISDLKHQMDSRAFGQDAAHLERAPLDLHRRILRSIPRLLARMAEANGLSCTINDLEDPEFTDLPWVSAHRDAVACVFRNLLDNSVKYHDRETRRVDVALTAFTTDGLVYIDYQDRGIGVLDSDVQRIFDDTYRGRNARALIPQGLGRGLADCRRIMNHHGGIDLIRPSGPTSFRLYFKEDHP